MKSLVLTTILLSCALILYGQNKVIPQVPSPLGPLTPSGHIRCYTMEADQYSRQLHPERGSLSDFENWLEPYVRQYKDQITTDYRAPLLTIPVVFHIITDGAGAENLSAAIVQAQLNQLNIDFRNLAGSTDPAAADVEVEFCLATLDPSDNIMAESGINRITTFGDGPFGQADFEGPGNIKEQTQWDPTQYMNIWVADLSGGLLGYAQFPDASGLAGMPVGAGGAAYEDGVVAGYGTIGSVAMPGSAPPYNLGRTMTHEVGHWVGLRHIWGDGGCGVDDFCGDTPESDNSNFGCPNHTSCGTGDMVENYMDYTDDACMDIFTADQKARVRTVFTNCVRRMELPNSMKCGVPTPIISFVDPNSTNILEGTDCSFQDIVLDLQISMAATDAATVNFSASGTASGAGLDYEFFPASTVFPAGSTADQQVTIRIYNDGLVEGTEDLTIDFTVSTVGDAIATTGDGIDHQVVIADDDYAPAPSVNQNILFADFEAGANGFTTTGNTATDFVLGNEAAVTAGGFWQTDGTNTGTFALTNDDACGNGCDKSDDLLSSPSFSLVGYTSAALTFDHAFSNVGLEVGEVRVSTDGGVTWTTEATLTNTSADLGGGTFSTPWVIATTINLNGYLGQADVRVAFHYNDGGGWLYGMCVDNISVDAGAVLGIQELVNSGTADNIQIRANEMVHFYDPTSTDVMGTIENTSTWNYGCTTVEVDRDQPTVGGAAAAFWDTDPSNFLMAKTYYIEPANNNALGTYNVSFYLTEAEIAAWEVATGKNRTDLKIVKVQNNPISNVNAGNYTGYNIEIIPATLAAFGGDWTLSASFATGFSGFGFGDPVITILSAEFLNLDAVREEENIRVNWATASEVDNDYFILEKSENGIDFEEIARIDAAGNSDKALNYSFLDEQAFEGYNYYRVKTIDFDGNPQQSKVVAVDMGVEQIPVIQLYPNPVSSALNLSFHSRKDSEIGIEIYDALGQRVYVANALPVFNGDNQLHLNVAEYNAGMYLIRIHEGNKAYTKRFVKQ